MVHLNLMDKWLDFLKDGLLVAACFTVKLAAT